MSLTGRDTNSKGRISHGRKKRLKVEDFTIGWICALPKEAIPAVLLLDEEYEPTHVPLDSNSYYFGRIGKHKIVIATLPKGSYGEISASGIAHDMARSFSSIRLCLLVGIGAGVPSEENDIRLGDVVVSAPAGDLGGVVQFDFGTEFVDMPFKRKGSLNKPPDALGSATSKFEINDRARSPISWHRFRTSRSRTLITTGILEWRRIISFRLLTRVRLKGRRARIATRARWMIVEAGAVQLRILLFTSVSLLRVAI